jgi:hypothetical protein
LAKTLASVGLDGAAHHAEHTVDIRTYHVDWLAVPYR